jgi:hypothetical protein
MEAHDECISDFVFEMSERYTSGFYKSFYETCCSMILNRVDLSFKQLEIIGREMKKRDVKIPKLSDFQLKLTRFLNFEMNGKLFRGKIPFDELFLALNISEEFNKKYRESFEKNTHLKDFHLDS